MNDIMSHQNKPRAFLGTILLLQLIALVAIILDIPILRQVLSIFYFCFLPGIIILRIIGSKLDTTETALFSLGISLAFLMFVGLLINELLPNLNILDPLSSEYVLPIISGAILVLSLISYKINDPESNPLSKLKLRLSPFTFAILCLPFLSAFGAVFLNETGNNLFLLIGILVIAAFIFTVICFRGEGQKYYPLLVLSVSLSILLQGSLVSNYIHGFDIHSEYYVFTLTKNNSFWDPNAITGTYADYNSMLSITILPSILTTFMNIDGIWIMKLVFPFFYAFVPIGVYLFARKYFGNKIAFLGAFLFMADFVFTQPLSNGKQMISELFVILLLITMFRNEMKSRNVPFLLILFMFGLVVSHYGTTFVFLIIISITFLLQQFKEKNFNISNIDKEFAARILLLFAMAFSWYIFTSESAGAFDRLLRAVNGFSRSLADFFILESRGSEVLGAIGLESGSTILHQINRILHYITQFAIVAGAFAIFLAKTKKISTNVRLLIYSNLAVIVFSIVLPFFSLPLRIERLYNILLLSLAPIGILGAITILRKLFKLRKKVAYLLLTGMFLIPFFLFQSGFVFEVAQDRPSNVSLSLARMGPDPYTRWGFLDENDVAAAIWLGSYRIHNERVFVLPVTSIQKSLQTYGMIYVHQIKELTDWTSPTNGSFIFLNEYITDKNDSSLLAVSDVLTNKIYDNGFSEIYRTSMN